MHKMDPPKSIGEINNVQSKDTSALRDLVVFFHNLWACPLQVAARLISTHTAQEQCPYFFQL